MSEINREEWLKNLQPGDVVCSDQSYMRERRFKYYKVEKITPSGMIKLQGGATVDNIGRSRGTKFGRFTIIPVTEEILEIEKKTALYREMYDNLTNLRLDTIQSNDIKLVEQLHDILQKMDIPKR